jgi:hypothetical protein
MTQMVLEKICFALARRSLFVQEGFASLCL